MEGNLRYLESVCVLMHACVLCWTVLVDRLGSNGCPSLPSGLNERMCVCLCVCLCACECVCRVYEGMYISMFSLKTRPREAAWVRLFVFSTVLILVKKKVLACSKVNRASLYYTLQTHKRPPNILLVSKLLPINSYLISHAWFIHAKLGLWPPNIYMTRALLIMNYTHLQGIQSVLNGVGVQ